MVEKENEGYTKYFDGYGDLWVSEEEHKRHLIHDKKFVGFFKSILKKMRAITVSALKSPLAAGALFVEPAPLMRVGAKAIEVARKTPATFVFRIDIGYTAQELAGFARAYVKDRELNTLLQNPDFFHCILWVNNLSNSKLGKVARVSGEAILHPPFVPPIFSRAPAMVFETCKAGRVLIPIATNRALKPFILWVGSKNLVFLSANLLNTLLLHQINRRVRFVGENTEKFFSLMYLYFWILENFLLQLLLMILYNRFNRTICIGLTTLYFLVCLFKLLLKYFINTGLLAQKNEQFIYTYLIILFIVSFYVLAQEGTYLIIGSLFYEWISYLYNILYRLGLIKKKLIF